MTFKEEKGREISRAEGVSVRIIVHEKTDPRFVEWLDEAIHKASLEKKGD
jgi:hypothetical protein